MFKVHYNRIRAIFARYLYYCKIWLIYKDKNEDDFYYSVKKEWSNRNPFGKMDTFFYQTHPSLNLFGARPTLVRIRNYEILKYCKKKSVILDIGSNVGFFSLYLSQFVEMIHAVEFDKSLHSIAVKTKKFLNINNVYFYNDDIKTIDSLIRYDVVMSFSVHQWVGIPIEDYLELVLKFKKENGIIFIESHGGNEDRSNLIDAIKKSNLTIISEGITDDYAGVLRDFYILK